MVLAAIYIVFPRPVIFERHELIDVHRPTVDEALVLGINPPGKIMRLWALV